LANASTTATAQQEKSLSARARELLTENPNLTNDQGVRLLKKEFRGRNDTTLRRAMNDARYEVKKKQGTTTPAGAKQGGPQRNGKHVPAPAAATPPPDPKTLTPYKLLVLVNQHAVSVGSLANLRDVFDLASKHTPTKLLEAIALAKEVGLDRFRQLCESPTQQEAIKLCGEVGTEVFGETVKTLTEIDKDKPRTDTDESLPANAQPPSS